MRLRITTIVLLALLASSTALAQERLRMSTTTSTENSGLLTVLLPPFEKQCNCHVDVISVGTGKALKLGETGDVADGYGVNRRDVMYNDFVIIGPAPDPAHVKGAKTSAEAFKRIADSKSTFISRGDESGTHQKEKEIWAKAGLTPQDKWYRSAGQGMGEVITMATEQRAYTLSDRGTYNAFRHGKTDLSVVFEGEKEIGRAH